MKKLFILFVLFTVQTFADPLCLSQATNYEIGNEVWRRLDFGFGVGESFQLYFTCDVNSNLTVERVDLETGEVKNYTVYASYCQKYRDLFDIKLQKLSTGKLIAWCNGSTELVRLLITAKGQLKPVGKSNVRDCFKDADAINAKL